MPWIMIYTTLALAALSVVGACCAKGLRQDPWRLVAIIAAAALWPVVVVGLIQFGAIHLYASHLRRRANGPLRQTPVENEPATTPMVLVDSIVAMARQAGAKRPA